MIMFAVRLREGRDLKKSMEDPVRKQKLSAATILSTVGSLIHVQLRTAGTQPDKQDVRDYDSIYEIVSVIGNLVQGRKHTDISNAASGGRVFGGHFKEGSIVHTTTELVLAINDKLRFSEEVGASTKFGELKTGSV